MAVLGVAKIADGPGGLALVERERVAPAAGQVVLDVHAAGICGTDLHIVAGEFPVPLGIVLGHEVAGAVAEIGPGVSDTWLGRRVVSETFFSTCGTCARCREGRVNLCADRHSIGSHVDGAFAAQVVVPAAGLHELPDWLEAPEASLTEPLACVCRCMLEPSVVAPGDRVLVIGPGPIGLLAAQVAALTAAEVVVLGLPNDASRLAIAKRLGLTVATDPMGLGTYDAVVECSGSADGAATALAAVRSGGRFVQLGIFGRDVSVPLDHVILKELTLRTGFATTPPSWSHALGLIARGDINLSEVVSEVVGLREFARAFDDLRRGVAAKIVFDPRLDETVPVAGTAIVPISDERGVASRSS